MIEILQFFQYLLYIPAIISFLLVAGFIADFSWGNEYDNFFIMYKHQKILKIALPILIFSFLYIFCSAEIIYSISRTEIKTKLNDKPINIKINGKEVFNDNLILDFKNIKRIGAERISGNTEFKIQLNDMKFRLVEDHSRDSLYLVYYENYRTTSNNPIGKLISNSLKNY